MTEYRLQYEDKKGRHLTKHYPQEREGLVRGDFYVVAIRGTTDIDKHQNRGNNSVNDYTRKLMTLDEARTFIERFRLFEGSGHDCMGLYLDDLASTNNRYINFEEPIQIRDFLG